MAIQRYTVNTLASQIRGEGDFDVDAAGGSVPDRLKNIIRECGRHVWTAADWRWQQTRGTLTTVADQAYADAPDNFGKLSQQWLNREGGSQSLMFTENPAHFQHWDDQITETGQPTVALVSHGDDDDVFSWQFLLTPTPDAVYTFNYWYLLRDPWSYDTVLADDASPVWPSFMDEGWRWLSLARASYTYGGDWQGPSNQYASWLKKCIANNNETNSSGVDYIDSDGYGDMNFLYSDLSGNFWL
jgi:hypothetical protein